MRQRKPFIAWRVFSVYRGAANQLLLGPANMTLVQYRIPAKPKTILEDPVPPGTDHRAQILLWPSQNIDTAAWAHSRAWLCYYLRKKDAFEAILGPQPHERVLARVTILDHRGYGFGAWLQPVLNDDRPTGRANRLRIEKIYWKGSGFKEPTL